MDAICETIEEVSDRKKEKHAEYFESVESRAKDIGLSVEAAEDATPGQLAALRNMLDGVDKWR